MRSPNKALTRVREFGRDQIAGGLFVFFLRTGW